MIFLCQILVKSNCGYLTFLEGECKRENRFFLNPATSFFPQKRANKKTFGTSQEKTALTRNTGIEKSLKNIASGSRAGTFIKKAPASPVARPPRLSTVLCQGHLLFKKSKQSHGWSPIENSGVRPVISIAFFLQNFLKIYHKYWLAQKFATLRCTFDPDLKRLKLKRY